MLSKSILSYQGPLSFSTIDRLLSEFKVAAEDHELSFRTYKKMVSLMIEALENVSKYTDHHKCNGENARPEFCPSCHITCNSSRIVLVTRNPVKKKEVAPLRSRIDHVNMQNRKELKELYMSTMTNGQFSPNGGAGLGFIEMAKTTGNKLEYAFEHLDRDYSLYTLSVSLSM